MNHLTEQKNQEIGNQETRKQEAGEKLERSESLVRVMQENRWFMEHIEHICDCNQVRFHVLEHIFLKMGKLGKEEIRNDIYRYGSMIKGNDLLARQLFLWLLEITEGTTP